MPLLFRLSLLLALSGVASGCQLAPQGTGSGGVTPNAVAGGAIEVTALDAAPALAADPALAAGAMASAASQEAPPAPGPQATDTPPAPLPAAGDADGTAPAGSADEAAAEDSAEDADAAQPAAPEARKSAAQIACERKRGNWATTNAGLNTCVKPTRDGGERCTRESQCEGLCLARSGTCAPVVPLLGCNEILQDNGVRATLCIE